MKSDTPSESPSSPKPEPKSKSGLMRLLLAGLVGGLVIVVGGLLIVTSSWFVSGTILPMAGGTINSTMEASRVSGVLSSQLQVNDFRLTPNEEETLVKVKELSVGYDLMEIIGGRIVASDLTVNQPEVELVVKSDGSMNIDPILEALSGPQPESGPPNVDLQRLKIDNGVIRIRVEGKNADSSQYELSGLNAEVDRLANGADMKVTLGGDLAVRMTEAGQTSELQASLNESATVTWDDSLAPVSFEAAMAVVVSQVTGVFSEFANNRVELSGTLSNDQLNPLSVKISDGDEPLGTLSVTGPLNLSAGTAELQYSLSDLNEKLLNQFRDLVGFTFGEPTISASGDVSLTQGGNVLALDSVVRATEVKLQQGDAQTPLIDLELTLALAADLAALSYNVETFSLTTTQGGRPLINASIEKPLRLKLGALGLQVEETAGRLGVSEIDLADWRALLGDSVSGKLKSDWTFASEGENGGALKLDGSFEMDGFGETSGSDPSDGLGVNAVVSSQIKALKEVDVSAIKVNVNNAKGKLLEAAGSGSFSGNGVLAMNANVAVINPAGGDLSSMDVGVEAAGRVAEEKAVLESVTLTFPPTEKVSSNRVTLSGSLAPGGDEGISGQLRLFAKQLDVTPLLAFYETMPSESAPQSAESETPPAEGEPDPIELPVKKLNATLQVDQLIAREIVVDQWLTEVVVEKGGVQVTPMTLSLNGAPVEGHANLDFSVPGYRYDIGLTTSQLPAGPFLGSLRPALKGVYDGMIDVGLDLKGAGTTGVNLRKNLAGNANLNFAGANIELFDSWKKLFLTPVAVVLRIPEMLESPIQGVVLQSNFADGVIGVGEFKVLSPAFQVLSSGKIPIADDLMASAVALPIDLTMKKEMAIGANLVNEAAEAIEGFVKLPSFVSLEGSVGEPAVNIDKVAVGKLFIRNVAGLPESVVGQAGQALQGLGGLVGGEGDEKNAAGKLIEGVGGLIGGETGGGLKEAGSALRGLFNRPKKDEKKE